MLIVTLVGLAIMSRFGGPAGGMFGPFVIVWVVIGLLGSAMAFYNALSKEGLPIYEVDMDEDDEDEERLEAGPFCPHCGNPVDPDDQFCRHCGTRLSD